MVIGRIKTERLSDRVSEIIVKLIREEHFKPGDKFYSENTLVKRLGVSRSSIREALRSLESTGWISVQHGRGVFINLSNERSGEGFVGWLKSNREIMLDHFEVRLMLDPKAAAHAARKAKDEEIAKLYEICDDFKEKVREGNVDALILLDEKFHSTLALCTKNKTLYVLMRTMAKSLPEGWISSLHIPGRVEKTIAEHCAVVAAIANKDPDGAETAMVTHLQNARREITSFMENNKLTQKSLP